MCFFVFFFKQKTAYEMRISDWSSDVCSSDLETGFQAEFDIGDLFLSAYLIGTEIGTLAGGGRRGELTSRGYAACGIGDFKQRRVWRACAVAPARADVQQRIITQPGVQTNGQAGLFPLVADDRSDERRFGTEGVVTVSYRWGPQEHR